MRGTTVGASELKGVTKFDLDGGHKCVFTLNGRVGPLLVLFSDLLNA